MKSPVYIKLGLWTAIISFLIGSIIFGLYYRSSRFELLFVGYGYIVFAGLINFIVLGIILFRAFRTTHNRTKLFLTSGLMLVNIPVMLLYCQIATVLINTMRITFKNDTQTVITDINITGCKPNHIEKLEIGQSKTVWVGITGDCSVNVDYLSNGQRKEESVVGYVTNNMGQMLKHNIGGKNDNIF